CCADREPPPPALPVPPALPALPVLPAPPAPPATGSCALRTGEQAVHRSSAHNWRSPAARPRLARGRRPPLAAARSCAAAGLPFVGRRVHSGAMDSGSDPRHSVCGIVPPHLLQRIARAEPDAGETRPH